MSYGFTYVVSGEVLVHAGDQGTQVFTLLDRGSPFDLTGATVTLVLKGKYLSDGKEIPCNVSAPGTSGVVYFIPNTDTWASFDIEYSGHFRIRLPSGLVRRIPDNVLAALSVKVSNA